MGDDAASEVEGKEVSGDDQDEIMGARKGRRGKATEHDLAEELRGAAAAPELAGDQDAFTQWKQMPKGSEALQSAFFVSFRQKLGRQESAPS